MVLTQPISTTEAAMACLGLDLVDSNITVQSVNSAPPLLRELLRLQHRPNAAPPLHPVDKYCMRPALLHSTTFTQYYRQYSLKKEQLLDHPGGAETLIGRDYLGNWVYARPAAAVVRFSDYHPGHHTKAFFYNILLDRIPFTREADLYGNGNTEQCPIMECYNRGFMPTSDALQHLLQQYALRHMHTTEQRDQLIFTVLQQCSLQLQGEQSKQHASHPLLPQHPLLPPPPMALAGDAITLAPPHNSSTQGSAAGVFLLPLLMPHHF